MEWKTDSKDKPGFVKPKPVEKPVPRMQWTWCTWEQAQALILKGFKLTHKNKPVAIRRECTWRGTPLVDIFCDCVEDLPEQYKQAKDCGKKRAAARAQREFEKNMKVLDNFGYKWNKRPTLT
jgi:hypothetical protein